MYTEKTIQHDGTEFIIQGRKMIDAGQHGVECDGCENVVNHVTVLRKRATSNITFWCDDCVQIAQDGR